MKKLFEFKIPKIDTVTETETTTNDKGEEVTTSKEVKKSVDKELFLRKPTRKLFDEAELFYGVELSKGIKAGLLTRALLQKRFSNDGGTLGEKEQEEWSTLYNDIFDKQVELQKLSLKAKGERTPEEQARYTNCQDFIREARSRIQEFEMQQSSLFDQTAENRARNRTILWWVLHLGYQVDGENETPFFSDGEYLQRLEVYDKMEEEEDEYVAECINKFFYYVSFWYVSKTSDPQVFKDLIKFAEQEDLNEELEATEVTLDGDEEKSDEPEEAREDPFENVADEAPTD